MKVKPMIFNTEMVKAILSGKKTVTRRPMKPQPYDSGHGHKWFPSNIVQSMVQIDNFKEDKEDYLKGIIPYTCPIACKGDLIYVRETFLFGRIFDYDSGHPESDYFYVEQCEGEDNYVISKAYCEMDGIEIDGVTWTPSIHMPRHASRLTLRVTDVRIERVKDITPQQALSEGINHQSINCPVAEFGQLWNSIYQDWDCNPYVWVIEFDVIHKNVDKYLAEIAS